MKTGLALAILLLACVITQQVWLDDFLAGRTSADDSLSRPVPQSTLERRITSRVLTTRELRGQNALTPDPEVRDWLTQRMKSGLTSPESLAADVRKSWPQYQDVKVMQTYSLLADEILSRVESWSDASQPQLTHLSVGVVPGLLGVGTRAVVIAGLRLPTLTPAALDNPDDHRFYTTCPQCHQGQPCAVPHQARVIKLRCQHCNQVYSMLAAGPGRHYRYVSEFLTGFAPQMQFPAGQSRLQELMTIWRAATQECHYRSDGPGDDTDTWQTAGETLRLKQGDCEDLAIFLADWLIARGFQARVAIGRYREEADSHSWIVVRLENHDYVIEPTEFPFNLQRPPLVSELGTRYKAELTFDRQAIYSPKNADIIFGGDFWSDDTWQRVPLPHAQDFAHVISGE